jgi:hypothetical protein
MGRGSPGRRSLGEGGKPAHDEDMLGHAIGKLEQP